MSDVSLLQTWAQRLTAVATGSEDEIKKALGTPTQPAPLGADEVEVYGGSRPSAELRWFTTPTITRAQLDGLFGTGEDLPRTGPGAAHVVAYDVRVAGAPAKVTVFARFSMQPKSDSAAKSVMLRIDIGA